jgi:hypothetical protein
MSVRWARTKPLSVRRARCPLRSKQNELAVVSRLVFGLERVLAHVTRTRIHPTREAPLLRVWRRWLLSVCR